MIHVHALDVNAIFTDFLQLVMSLWLMTSQEHGTTKKKNSLIKYSDDQLLHQRWAVWPGFDGFPRCTVGANWHELELKPAELLAMLLNPMSRICSHFDTIPPDYDVVTLPCKQRIMHVNCADKTHCDVTTHVIICEPMRELMPHALIFRTSRSHRTDYSSQG